MSRLPATLAAFLSASLLGAAVLSPAQDLSYDEIAQFLAGQPVGGALAPLASMPSVQAQAAVTRELSDEWRDRRLNQLREWAKEEIHRRIPRPEVVKYPFGGPDFVHAATLFPGASEYILVGLEPLGSVPQFLSMDEPRLSGYLSHLNHSLRSISRRSFFITTEMREDFGEEGVDGVFPVLLYFAALTRHEVLDARYVRLTSAGEAEVCQPGEANGVWLQIRALDRLPIFPETQSLYYFKTDLSNAGFKPGSPLKLFFEKRPGGMGYLKAASYLMHTEGFTNIRNFMVGDCQWILQDESGIPAEFLALYYDLTYYGQYVGPIDTFAEHEQPFLHSIYASGAAKPLPFGVGYRMRDQDSIQLFGIRK